MAKKYLSSTGLTHLWEKIKSVFAPLVSPTFTGIPIAPTAATTTNSTQIATTQYVQNNMANCYTQTDADTALAKKVNIDGTTPMSYLTVGTRKNGSTIGQLSIATGDSCTASGPSSHAEGSATEATAAMAHAEGDATKAVGAVCHAEGFQTTASGTCSHAEGQGTTASNSSHAEGGSTIASGMNSHAEGMQTQATEVTSHAEGMGTVASGQSAHAEGSNTTADMNSAHAEGEATLAHGIFSHAEGNSTKANGAHAHSEGEGTVAGGTSSHAGGGSTIASGDYQTAIGTYNIEDTTGTNLFIVGNGAYDRTTSTATRSNALVVTKTGDVTAGNDVIDGHGNKLSDKATIKTIAVTIPTSSWASNAATVVATGVTTDNSVIITPAPASYNEYANDMIYCSAQAANSLTFTCTTTPTVSITVNVLTVG